MSFSSDVKGELARIETNKKAEQLAEIAGFLRVSSSVRLAGGGNFVIVCETENAAIARHYKWLIKEYFRSNASFEVGESLKPGKSKNGANRYILSITPEEKSGHILRETGLLLIREGMDFLADGIYPEVVKSKGSKRAYLRGLFLGAGTVTDPRKSYHLEFVVGTSQTANDLKRIISTFEDLSANINERKGRFAVYMKKADYISDTLALMGAGAAVLEMENIRIVRGQRAVAQRHDNCDYANMDRTLSAAEEQLANIKYIEENLGLDALSPELIAVAKLRLSQPEASLSEIGEALNPPIGKAAVSKRFAKIKEIADPDFEAVKECSSIRR